MVYPHNSSYTAIKRDKLIYTTAWMKLKIISLSERNQTKEYMLYKSSYIKFQQM